MKYRVVFETKIELDEDNIQWTDKGKEEFARVRMCYPLCVQCIREWQSRYLTECLAAANTLAAGGELEGTLAFGTARTGYSNNGPTTEPVDHVDTDEYADVYFHEVFGTVGYKIIEELHFLVDRAESPVEETE